MITQIVANMLMVGCLSADLDGSGVVTRQDLSMAPKRLKAYVTSCAGATVEPQVCGEFPLTVADGIPVLVPSGWAVQAHAISPTHVTYEVYNIITGDFMFMPGIELNAEWIFDLPYLPSLSVTFTGQVLGAAVGCAGVTIE